jgi:hypothetical protein
MRTQIRNGSLQRNRRAVGVARLLAALALLAAGTCQPSAAEDQRVITTIIPSEVITPDASARGDVFVSGKPVLLRFRTDALPRDATVTGARLRLTNYKIGESPQVTIQTFLVAETPPWDSKTLQTVTKNDPLLANSGFGDREFASDEPSKTAPWAEWKPTQVPAALKAGRPGQGGTSFAVLLLPSNASDLREWYSITAEPQHRPRLILEYTVPGRAASDRAEAVPATHSPRPFLPTAGARLGFEAVSPIWSYAPVFSNGLVYLVASKESGPELQALSPLGGQPLWSVLLTSPGQHLLLARSGRLYIVGNQQILVYQLDPSNAAPAAEVTPLSPKPVKDLNPTVAPAVGPDGSVYVVNGLEVTGLNPDLQALWRVALDDKATSEVTVGPSGEFVYLTSRSKGLIAINAQTGQDVAKALPNQDALKAVDNPALHAPLVIRASDGGERIYVAANSVGAGRLTCFVNPRTVATGGDEDITEAEKWPALDGLFSQPIASSRGAGAWTIYSVQAAATPGPQTSSTATGQGQLVEIDWLTGSTRAVVNALEGGGHLAADRDGNVLAWKGSGAKVSAFTAAGSVVELPLATSSSPADVSGLTFGTDGTLYAPDRRDTASRTLWVIIPQYTLANGSSATIDSPTHLRVDGSTDHNVTLTAGGNVILGEGFGIQRGATLAIGTGPRQNEAGKQ